jgi:hypothetical protein
MRDTHFSRIAQFVRDESLVKKLETCQDVVDAIHKRQEIANQNKKSIYYFVFIKFSNINILIVYLLNF